MTNKDPEYQLFKQLCQHQCIPASFAKASLLKAIKEKDLPLKTTDTEICLQAPITPLSKKAIYKSLSTDSESLIDSLEVHYQTDSTSKLLATRPVTANYTILTAEYQTQGQGRRNKQWFSPLAANLCFSIQFQLNDITNSHLLPLVTALAICRTLESQGVTSCQIKWPNDIYHNGKKLAGILCESRTSYNSSPVFVIGIGLNVNMNNNNDIDQLWTSLNKIHRNNINRNHLLSSLLSEILTTYNTLAQLNTTQFHKEWRSRDYLYNSPIMISDNKESYSAIARGIDMDGALLVHLEGEARLKKIYSADVSVKTDRLST